MVATISTARGCSCVARYGGVRFGGVWYMVYHTCWGMVWYGMIWYGRVWYGMLLCGQEVCNCGLRRRGGGGERLPRFQVPNTPPSPSPKEFWSHTPPPITPPKAPGDPKLVCKGQECGSSPRRLPVGCPTTIPHTKLQPTIHQTTGPFWRQLHQNNKLNHM